ncbi:MAG TPA: hypothetical protein PLS03_07905 [Terrimicrobiaceae bacterium]|nr:hypothetical protein [Terrimicrobiaceae bacterium]
MLHHKGKLVDGCETPGERRADGVAPAHPNGIQLSRDVFLLLVSTLDFRGVDDSKGIVGQLRRGGFDGPVIRELSLVRCELDWDLFGDGELYVRQVGHPSAFGVPKGAVCGGGTPAHANTFVLLWRCSARKISPDGVLYWNSEPVEVRMASQHVCWRQFRLNDAGDDLEYLTEPEPLRWKGAGDCGPHRSLPGRSLNQTFVQPVPYTPAADQWVVCNHFIDTSTLAVLRFAFNGATGLYEWAEISKEFGKGYFEASVLPWKSDWVIVARSLTGEDRAVSDPPLHGWVRVNDLFSDGIVLRDFPEPGSFRAPIAAYACPDGAVRWISGNKSRSPHGLGRNPLYLFEADVENGFRTKTVQTVFDAVAAKLPIQPNPIVDMGKLLPHSGGREQILVHRVRTVALRQAEADLGAPAKVLQSGDFASTAMYYATLDYGTDMPATWDFPAQP